MTTLRPAGERLRDQRRREIVGWIVVAAGALAASGLFSALVTRFGW